MVMEELISELGSVYALDIEASNFPELANAAEVVEVKSALVRATEAVAKAAVCGEPDTLATARRALDEAGSAAQGARRLLTAARTARNRRT